MTHDLPLRIGVSALVCWMALAVPSSVLGAGSGLHVLVVANDQSPDSLELANYYVEQRQVPPENLLRISWSGGNIQWTQSEFDALLLNPLLAYLAADSQRSNQIDYIVLSMDIPYRVVDGSARNSITSALFYGFKDGSGLNNSYAGSEDRFPSAKPDTAPVFSFLTTMLTADSLDQAKLLVDQGVASDGSRPTETAWLVKTSDQDRNRRYVGFDNAIFDARLRQSYDLVRTNSDSAYGITNMLGFQTGLANFSVSSNAFVPGAMADSKTSFGGMLFEDTGQTTLLEFIDAGAAGSYGAVTEPGTSKEKFPTPQVYFYQSRGFTLAECYYQGLVQPHYGLIVGDPLAAPFRADGSIYWGASETNTVLQGTTNLLLSAGTDEPGDRVDRVDLFVNGLYDHTLTNLPPQAENRLTVRLNGYPVTYEVPTNATLTSIASAFADLLNQSTNMDVTRVQAQAFGDRIELQSLASPPPVGSFEFVDADAGQSPPRTYQAMRMPPWSSPGMTPIGANVDGDFVIQVASDPDDPYTIEASFTFLDWVPIHTNSAGGPMEFVDVDSHLYAYRFYRVIPPWPHVRPTRVTPLGVSSNGAFQVHVNGATNRGCIVQVSADFFTWSDVFTHESGGTFEFVDTGSTNQAQRFYRTRSAETNDYTPVTVTGQTGDGGNILQVEGGLQGDYSVCASTNSTDWFAVYTHTSPSGIRTETSSASGSGEPVTTGLIAAGPEFLDSTARGMRGFFVDPMDFFPPYLDNNSYLELTVTKTNGSLATVTATNVPGNTSDMLLFVEQLRAAVNTSVELMAVDGLSMEDIEGFFTGAIFNLRAGADGLPAAGIQAYLTGSSDLIIKHSVNVPHAAPVTLEENISDLRPRNHLYVNAGRSDLQMNFDLDTTLLPDGHHNLTAVGYGGDSVHAQTHSILPVLIDNTPLDATIESPVADLSISVTNSFDITVTGNTNTISEIVLSGTGGVLDTVTNQTSAIFTVDGLVLGVGAHPFHALVNTSDGMAYRTQTLHVTLTGN